jgi:hypothetical protein
VTAVESCTRRVNRQPYTSPSICRSSMPRTMSSSTLRLPSVSAITSSRSWVSAAAYAPRTISPAYGSAAIASDTRPTMRLVCERRLRAARLGR